MQSCMKWQIKCGAPDNRARCLEQADAEVSEVVELGCVGGEVGDEAGDLG